MKPEHPAVKKYLKKPQYGGQEMIQYGLARVPGIENTVFAPALDYFDVSEETTRWLDHCYPPALEEIPEPWRAQAAAFIEANVGLMTESEVRQVETWGSGATA